jgi:hypothetical protein
LPLKTNRLTVSIARFFALACLAAVFAASAFDLKDT